MWATKEIVILERLESGVKLSMRAEYVTSYQQEAARLEGKGTSAAPPQLIPHKTLQLTSLQAGSGYQICLQASCSMGCR
jgi:uncharacterized protein affecting Mg2+/Co2+ transport